MFETAFIIFAIVIGYNVVKTKAIKKDNILLSSQNKKMQEVILHSDEEGNYTPHCWEHVGKERTFPSSLKVDYIEIETRVCNKCMLVHRHITRGYLLAEKLKISDIEGFYANNIKCADNGCLDD